MKSFYSKRVIKLLLFDRQRGKCNGCRGTFAIGRLEIDHIIPRAGGGSDIPSNFQLLCKPCNIRKRAGIIAGVQYNLFDQPRETTRTACAYATRQTDRPMTNAEKQRRKRKRAKADGICNICFAARARAGMVTCQDCSDAAAGRVRAARKAAKKRTRKH